MQRSCIALLASALVLPTQAAEPPKAKDANALFAPELFQALEYRSIGPFRGGRVTAATGVPSRRDTFYFGSTGGGVWKSADGGASWKPIADEKLEAASIGAIAVAPSDPNVIYVGTGSACPRGNVSPGNGVYRSTDGGETWQHVGLPEAGQIGRICVHPGNPELVYVAALGHAFGPNPERGVFRSKDGGQSWEKVLYVSERAGAVDLSLDPTNPRILVAAIWQMERKPWTFIGGGDGSGIHRSRDGGTTWEKLTEGLPKGPLGRIGVSLSGARPGRLWALIEAEDGGLYRSDDYGKTFKQANPDRNFRQRAWYYTHVFADPRDAETVYVLNTSIWRSHDAGKSFELLRDPHGDNHDLWINPLDPQVLINGNDGGANVSYNAGRSWSTQLNQPTGEFYRVTTDAAFPYRIYGCQQDNTCVSIASRTGGGGIGQQDWHVIAGGESGHVAVDPRDPNVTYAGSYGGYLTRQDFAVGQERNVTPWPQVAVGLAAADLKYRFQWNAPLRLSPHDPDTLYVTSQVVHRSRDQGQSWEVISPDLTRNDRAKQGYAGEPVTRDNTGVEVYDTIFAFEESPRARGVLWAGSDDGRVHLSRDDGKSWRDVTPPRTPEWGQVNMIEPSPHDAARAFLAVTRYRLDDYRPYVFRTDDYGASWKLLTTGKNGIPERRFVRVVREDPDRRGLLYAGTEFGLYVSFDDGDHWQSLQQKLPVTPITDLAVKSQDLVVATQGRGFWILDDVTPLHQLTREAAAAGTFLFRPREVTMFSGGSGGPGKNPPEGVVIQYLLKEKPKDTEEVRLELLDAQGRVLRKLSSLKDEPRAPDPYAQYFPEAQRPAKLDVKAGMNRWVWDLRLADAELVDDAVFWGDPRGPRVAPGTYRARLTRGNWSATTEFHVRGDPRLKVTPSELEARFALAEKISASVSETHRAVKRIRDVRKQANDLVVRLEAAGKGDGLKDPAKALADKLTALEEKLHQYRVLSSQDPLNFPQGIDGQLMGLQSVVESADAGPTDSAVARYAELRRELDGYQAQLRAILDTDLAAFNRLVRAKDVPPVL
ncbi:MAG TPA: hypothetical protein VJS92_03740 [Candidatus Polarisedimenticolaceae bacterium]|nr:hypothetical protein [Candidatus Polarisedimenticolaceae bacterium]